MSFPDASAPLDAATLAPHLESIRRLARGLVAGDDLADDVVQETWVVALRRPPAEREHLGGWLAGIARNVARNLRRGQRRRLAREAQAAREGAAPSPAEVVERIEEHRRVLELARELEEPYRSTIVLRFFDDLTPTEIAARLGRPVPTVKTHLRRGLERLRARLDADHGGDRARWQHALGPIAFGTPRPRPTASWSPWSVAAAVAVVAVVGVIGVRTFLLEDRSSGTGAPQALVADGGGLPGADAEASSPSQRLRPGGGMEGAAGAAGGLAAAEAAGRNGMERELVIPVGFEVVGGRVPATVVVRGQDLAVRRFPVGEDGNVRLRDLPEGMYVAWIESPSTLTSSDTAFSIPYAGHRLPTLLALPAASLDVRVVDAKSKEPVAGARVAVHEGGQSTGAPGWTGTTGADGRVRIQSVPGMGLEGLEILQVCATGPGHQPGRAQVVLPPKALSTLQGVTVELAEGVALRGRAVDDAGVGVSGAVVVAAPKPLKKDVGGPDGDPPLDYDEALLARIAAGPSQVAVGVVHANDARLEDRPDAVAVRTGGGGAFDLEGLRPGTRYELLGFLPGHPSAVAIFDPEEAGGDLPLTLRFAEYGSAVITVSDEEGRRIAAPKVLDSPSTWRNEEGRLVAEGLPPGELYVRLSAAGRVGQGVQLQVESGRRVSAEVRLRPALELRGVVVGSDGTPIPRASVGIGNGGEGCVEWTYAQGDGHAEAADDGTFVIGGALPGRYELYAHGEGHRSRWRVPAVLPGDPVRIVLESSVERRLTLRITVPEGVDPPAEVVVHMLPSPMPDDGMMRSLMMGAGRWRMSCGPEQKFVWRDDGYPVRLQRDAGVLVVATDRFAPVRLTLPAGAVGPLSAVLSPGRSIRGRLLDVHGTPIPLGRIRAYPGTPGSPSARSAADGTFTLEHVPPGDAILWGGADGHLATHVVAPAAGGDAPVELRLPPGVVVKGLVTGWHPTACSCATIRALLDGRDSPDAGEEWEADYHSGRFQITLAPGRYVLEATERDRVGRLPIVVEEGKPLDVTVDMVPTKPPADDR